MAIPRGAGGDPSRKREIRVAKGFIEPIEKPRRFYKAVEVVPEDGGFAVRLDGRGVRTPKGGRLTLPTRALADMVAEEWAAQGETLEIAGMHATRLANTAIESIPPARAETADAVASYAASDLICYFAEEPVALVERQQAHWEPVLTRIEEEAKVSFVRAAGIVHQAQPEETLAEVRAIALAEGDFGLAGLAFGAALFGSAILAIGLRRGWLTGVQAFELSQLDEIWQAEKWGVDEEAAERAERLKVEALMLERWFRALPD
ncbi:ATP12 family chaperone protein [Phenylobacterium soli]|uniref:ATP12 family chaperone protein n=1 Tax=Phenylobacterium soli TaxID=2170551 RepID=UPI001403B4C9|nr:ATP12 family protein [Phenylobacterium soli]